MRGLARRGWNLRAFRFDTRGQIATIFALSSVVILTGIGASVDLARAYAARQKLSQVATLACQYSTRPSVARTANSSYSGSNGFQTYVAAVNAFATASLTAQNWNGAQPAGGSATPNSYFTATPAVGGSTPSATEPTNPAVEMAASVPTIFGQIVHMQSIPVHAKVTCQTLASVRQIVNPPTLVKEGFETACASYCFASPTGQTTTPASASNSFPTGAGYVGYNGFKWYIVGYCLETDAVGVISSSVPEGTHSAELDCDNGSGSAGNSSISTSAYLEAGQFELRYNYRSRIDYPDYDPTYICGSTASDVSWASNTNAPSIPNALRTNQINVYLDANLAGTNGTTGSAPLHRTIDGNQYLAGANLIDTCVYSPTWIERSVKIKVANPGFYWLSFAADGTSDSYGGQIDNIRLCQALCAGSLQDNFPSAWLAANNSGANKVLFEDTFEAPVYTQDPSTTSAHAKGGNLANSLGTSGKPSSGWPTLAASGWATAPYNELNYWMQGSSQGTQYVSLQGWNGFSNTSDPINRMISRYFLLDPGYYAMSYLYTSQMDFSYDFIYGINCSYLPTTTNSYNAYGLKNGHDYGDASTVWTQYRSTNFMNVYVAHGSLISTPKVNSTLGGAATYTNPDGSVTSSPVVPPDNGSIFSAYNANAVNPVIDTCSYSSGHVWVPRTINIKITKPGLYWLTFSAQGDPLTGTGAGPALDDVKLTALGSPYMSNPPASTLAAIPVPSPQPDTSYAPGTYPGFTIVADPFTPPAADQ